MTPENKNHVQAANAVINPPEEALQKKRKKRKMIILLSVIAAAVVIAAVVVVMIVSNMMCYASGCMSFPISDGFFCEEHTCKYDGCVYGCFDGTYCSDHSCGYRYGYCENLVLEGKRACSEHICKATDCNQVMAFYSESGYCDDHVSTIQFCKEEGCYEPAQEDTGRCSAHSYNMRERLTDPTLSFTMDSAGRIEIYFNATNATDKTIKYVRFKVYYYNAVDDMVRDDLGDSCGVAELIGPVESGQKITVFGHYVGYCETAKRIVIPEIEVEYTDGTVETGVYDLSYEK